MCKLKLPPWLCVPRDLLLPPVSRWHSCFADVFEREIG